MQEQKPPSRKKQPLTDYGRYAGMAIQMGATIALGVWGGRKLDEWLEMQKFPVFTVILSLLSVFVAMYWAVRDLLRKK